MTTYITSNSEMLMKYKNPTHSAHIIVRML